MRVSFLAAMLGVVLWAGAAPAARDVDPGTPVEIARSYELRSEILDQTRRINVYLPPSYAESDTVYPVLYLLDGGIHEDFFHIAGIASLAADFRNIEEFIVVGIEGIDRYHDLTPPSSQAADLERIPTSGGSAAFRAFLAEELKPYVESHLRVSPESTLIGESVAGLFVVETLLLAPALFENYIAVSPSLWWDDRSLVRGADAALSRGDFPPRRRVYLTIADEGEDMREGVDRLAEAIGSHAPNGMIWTYRPFDHESHGTIFHPAALDAIRWMFAITR